MVQEHCIDEIQEINIDMHTVTARGTIAAENVVIILNSLQLLWQSKNTRGILRIITTADNASLL